MSDTTRRVDLADVIDGARSAAAEDAARSTVPAFCLREPFAPPPDVPARFVVGALADLVSNCRHENHTSVRRSSGAALLLCPDCGAVCLQEDSTEQSPSHKWRRPALHARLAEVLAYVAAPPALTEPAPPQDPTYTRVFPVGFDTGETLVQPGEARELHVRPQVLFRGELLRVASHHASRPHTVDEIGPSMFELSDLAVSASMDAPLEAQPASALEDADAMRRAEVEGYIRDYQRELEELAKPRGERCSTYEEPPGVRWDSQLAAGGPMPLLEGAHGLRVQMDCAEPGQSVRLIVRNVGPRPARLRALLEGTVIE